MRSCRLPPQHKFWRQAELALQALYRGFWKVMNALFAKKAKRDSRVTCAVLLKTNIVCIKTFRYT